MIKRIIKGIVLAVFFAGALLISNYVMNRGTDDKIMTMGEPTLPVVSFTVSGQEINLLSGYVDQMDVTAMRDTITPLESNGTLQAEIAENGNKISKISYKVYSLDGADTYAEGKVKEEDGKVTLELGTALDQSAQEAVLKLTLTLGSGEAQKKVNYFTRIEKPDEITAWKCLTFAKDFHAKALDQSDEDTLSMYLEPGEESDNTTYQTVNIHSDITHIQWGDLNPEIVGDVQWSLKESNSVYTSILAKYQVRCQDDKEETARYNVKEFFRIRSVGDTIYLLDYNRDLQEVFSSSRSVMDQKGILLGIVPEDVPYETNKKDSILAFVQNRTLWMYNKKNEELTKVFSFAEEDTQDVRSLNDQHAVRIISMDDHGNIAFAVYGYMNRGEHEGEVGVGIYYFNVDSNLIQEAILNSVSTCRSGRYNIFMVGDVKQSIYRFRLSRPELFLEKFYTYNIEESQTQRIDLHRNFRSRKEVLESANAIFRQIMTEKLGGIVYDEQAALYPGAEYPETENLKTEILLMDSDLDEYQKTDGDTSKGIVSERELEARMIAMRIRELLRSQKVVDKETGELRNVRYSDIVILTRSVKGFADVFTEVLNREGIPAYAGTSEGYFQTQEVGVLLDYLRVLDNRRQDIPLAAVLRSAFAEMSDEEMAEIRCMYPDKPFFESVAEYRVHGREQKIREKLEKCLGQMDELRLIVPYTPMHELLWKILDRTGYGDYVAAMPGGAQRRANLDMLIEKARAYEATSYKGLFHFVRYIEQLQKYDVDYGEASIEDEYADTVRVMTIHKSKGLEFPVVITAGMGKRFNMQDARSAVALHAGMGVGLDAVDLEYRTKIPSIIKKVIQKEEALESLGEELRVLYVALTRAKEKLIITGTLSKPEDKIAGYQMFGKDTEGTLSFSQLSHASTYWDWILPAVLKCREDLFRIQILHIEDVVKESIEEEEKSGLSRTVLENWNVEEIYEPGLHEMMQEQFAFSYPYEKSSERKLKFTVTELKKRAYEIASDEREEEQGECFYEEPEVVPLLPRFMQQEEGLTGAPRGTAYHRVMELLDFAGMQKYGNMQWFGGWLEEQVRHGRLEEEAAGCIRQADILEFLQCNSGKRMQEAARKQKLYREQPFVLGVDAKELYPEEEDGELILIQGIIDAYFEEPDGLVVLDYKTDKVNNGKELAEKYQEQLRYYAKALEQMSGKKVKEKIIYSFTLKKEIYIE